MRYSATALLLLLVGARLFAADASSPYDQAFWAHWGDGRGELAAYDLTFPRYGELRRGTAVTVFVTEPFSVSALVKADPGKHPDSDVVQAMKLNLVRDFQTGIYDYNLMNSIFVALQPAGSRPPGSVLKSVFSSQEWCGQVYSQLLFGSDSIAHEIRSYFDGETGAENIELRGGSVSEDAILLWARGLAAPFLARGETRRVPILGSLTDARLAHRPVTWREAVISSSAKTRRVTVPAGSFDAETRRVEIAGGLTWTVDVEAAAPHRILRWNTSSGETGELLASDRLPYWKMNGEAFRDAVRKLGLTPRPPRTM